MAEYKSSLFLAFSLLSGSRFGGVNTAAKRNAHEHKI